MNILIIEDEVYNFKLLRHMLEELVPDCCIMGPLYTITQTKDFLEYTKDIDIIIADIQLSDGLSFEALRYANDNVPIIFTTAYDEHALKAFDFNSLSYLLKPVDEDELAIAIRKARRMSIRKNGYSALFPKLADGKAFRERFVIPTSNGDRVVPLYNIRYIVSEHKTTYLHLLDEGEHHIDSSLDSVASQLDPTRFMRVNRKYIVPIEQVTGMHRLENGKGSLILKGDNVPEIIISREKKHIVAQWMRGDLI